MADSLAWRQVMKMKNIAVAEIIARAANLKIMKIMAKTARGAWRNISAGANGNAQ